MSYSKWLALLLHRQVKNRSTRRRVRLLPGTENLGGHSGAFSCQIVNVGRGSGYLGELGDATCSYCLGSSVVCHRQFECTEQPLKSLVVGRAVFDESDRFGILEFYFFIPIDGRFTISDNRSPRCSACHKSVFECSGTKFVARSAIRSGRLRELQLAGLRRLHL